jgi:serine/threonine-protein kinase RsbW
LRRIRLTTDSNLDDMVLLATAINRLCLDRGLNEVEAYHVELCVCEAVTNVIRHGYREERGHEVSVAFAIDDERIEMEISDDGRPLSQEQIEKLLHGSAAFELDPSDIASLKEGGRGLQIIHEIMDERSYRSEDKTNRMRLVKRLPAGR